MVESGIARANGRSYWQVRYRDGRVLSEWSGIDWTEIPRAGLIEARLLCPNGQTAVLGNTLDASDRLFQLKVAVLSLAGRQVRAQVLGLIVEPDGTCKCVAWQPHTNTLEQFMDNVHAMRYENLGAISLANLSVPGAG